MSTVASRATHFKVSAFLHKGFLVDTGCPRAASDLSRFLDREPIQGALVTHWHEDHSGNLPLLVRRGLPVTASRETLAAMPRTRALPVYRWAVWGQAEPVGGPPEPADHPFEVVPTPGHSPDHVVVFDPDLGIVFGGDLFLGVKASTVHPGEDPYAIRASVRRVLALEPRLYFDAHRSLLRDPAGALRAKADWLDTVIDAIETGLRRGDSDRVIRRRVLGDEGSMPFLTGGEMSKRNFVASIRARLGS